ncbi:MAG: DUF1003 domain-containing protein [Chroococcidiopsidaceae cyanobacterium CP_BM_RX_35]|nr:DUF1003 domain-containing protein [Chroococcidiopsidaceae cyanobacterium CP_BM_RX_35]
MNPKKLLSNRIEAEEKAIADAHKLKSELEALQPEQQKLSLGQRVADAMAAKVGSWAFLIGQTAVLTAWIGLNMAPGVRHWDESPFILLNLVFSFASAYTAPVVLMSQNRQSDIDREKAEYDHQVNLRAGQNIELLHGKLDTLQSQQLKELTQIVKEQQGSLNEIRASVVPAFNQQQALNEIKVGALPTLNHQNNGKFPNQFSVYVPSKLNRQSGDDGQVVE